MMKGMVAEVAVFADTNLGTRIAFNAPSHITAGAFKRDFEKVHFTCLPDMGEIRVHGLMVKRKSCFYYLPDSFPIKHVFPRMRETWFLRVEVRHLKSLRVPCLPRDSASLSKHHDVMAHDCENKTRCNSEEKREEGFQQCSYPLEENEANQVLKEKGISHENYKQHAASGMPERYSCMASKSRYVMPENKVENRVELPANSKQESPSKMSTQVISISGIINKYFSGFNGNDNFSSSSNSDVTSRVVHSEIEVQSNTRTQSCSKRQQIDSLPQFTPKTPQHVLHTPLHVDLVSKKPGSKTRRNKVERCRRNRRSKVDKCSKSRSSKLGKFLLSASKSLGIFSTKQSPSLSFCKFKNKILLEEKSQINSSIYSICDSDDD